jgi:hypothetical protein
MSTHMKPTTSGYLFLDFDGVLHPDIGPPNLKAAALLAPIVKDLNLQVVISSAWRTSFNLDMLKALLGPLGEHVIDTTPDLDRETPAPESSENDESTAMPFQRQREIELWLEGRATPGAPYMALDDLAFLFEQDCEWLYLVDGNTGLNESNIGHVHTWARELLDDHARRIQYHKREVLKTG